MEKLITYIKDSFNEVINNVSWPSFNNLTESTVLVIVGSLLFGAFVTLMDYGLNTLLGMVYK